MKWKNWIEKACQIEEKLTDEEFVLIWEIIYSNKPNQSPLKKHWIENENNN